MFLVLLNLFLLAHSRPQYRHHGMMSYPHMAQGLIPFLDNAAMVQEIRGRRQPDTADQDHHEEHHTQEQTYNSNDDESESFHFHEMPMKAFVQLTSDSQGGQGDQNGRSNDDNDNKE